MFKVTTLNNFLGMLSTYLKYDIPSKVMISVLIGFLIHCLPVHSSQGWWQKDEYMKILEDAASMAIRQFERRVQNNVDLGATHGRRNGDTRQVIKALKRIGTVRGIATRITDRLNRIVENMIQLAYRDMYEEHRGPVYCWSITRDDNIENIQKLWGKIPSKLKKLNKAKEGHEQQFQGPNSAEYNWSWERIDLYLLHQLTVKIYAMTIKLASRKKAGTLSKAFQRESKTLNIHRMIWAAICAKWRLIQNHEESSDDVFPTLKTISVTWNMRKEVPNPMEWIKDIELAKEITADIESAKPQKDKVTNYITKYGKAKSRGKVKSRKVREMEPRGAVRVQLKDMLNDSALQREVERVCEGIPMESNYAYGIDTSKVTDADSSEQPEETATEREETATLDSRFIDVREETEEETTYDTEETDDAEYTDDTLLHKFNERLEEIEKKFNWRMNRCLLKIHALEDGVTERDDKIKEIEARLAEKDAQILHLETKMDSLNRSRSASENGAGEPTDL